MDPLRDAQYDRNEAAEIRREEGYVSNPSAANDLERAAGRLDDQATELENEVAAANEPEADSESDQ